MGLGSRAVRTAFVNGRPARLGYLGQLRVDTPWRGTRGLLRGGFAGIHRLHLQAGEPAFYVTTLIEGNAEARRALARPRPGLPAYTEREALATLAIPLGTRRRARVAGVTLRRGQASDLPDVARCLQRNLQRLQFAPVWTADDLAHPERCRALSPSDFVLAVRGAKVVGCVALWDQGAFKQTIVRGYPALLGVARPAVNALGPLFGVPRLPRVGQPLRHAFLSHLAVDDDAPDVAVALARHALAEAPDRRLSYVATALSPRHPLFAPLRGAFRCLVYRSVLFTVHWDDGADAVAVLDDRVPHLEVAVL
jgi:hypothetical protein